jgi:hypothetical protein
LFLGDLVFQHTFCHALSRIPRKWVLDEHRTLRYCESEHPGEGCFPCIWTNTAEYRSARDLSNTKNGENLRAVDLDAARWKDPGPDSGRVRDLEAYSSPGAMTVLVVWSSTSV